jgi:hypothetical protein
MDTRSDPREKEAAMKEISNQFFMDLDSNGIVQILKY